MYQRFIKVLLYTYYCSRYYNIKKYGEYKYGRKVKLRHAWKLIINMKY